MARGILIDILSRPDGWETTADDMWRTSVALHGKDSPGRRAFRSAFAELKTHSYITTHREPLDGGRHGTVLVVFDVPHAGTSVPPAGSHKSPGRADIPAGGTSVPPAETWEMPGCTDVPHADTSVSTGQTSIDAGHSDVPHGGTSVPPAETPLSPGHTDVPACGTPAPPGQTDVFAGRSDVPHAGTSNRKRSSNTKENEASYDGELPQIGDRPRIPDACRPLVNALTAANLIVGWDLKPAEWFVIEALIQRCGIRALVVSARGSWEGARTQPRSGTYFLPAWRTLPDAITAPTPENPELPAVAGGDVLPITVSRQQREVDEQFARQMARARARMQQEGS